ncbi:unnamed protein product [Cyprideis torosa]|uniref:Uncharacterized protein n=1 Tax=Cyprideis torosa TaxID=163714 RepID=A0A7R8W6D8_9CRUS|nr:unnamed protein product [Cyprideis torosa]CAG0883987.1 unnamed protein product [Cyprideis torosa]
MVQISWEFAWEGRKCWTLETRSQDSSEQMNGLLLPVTQLDKKQLIAYLPGAPEVSRWQFFVEFHSSYSMYRICTHYKRNKSNYNIPSHFITGVVLPTIQAKFSDKIRSTYDSYSASLLDEVEQALPPYLRPISPPPHLFRYAGSSERQWKISFAFLTLPRPCRVLYVPSAGGEGRKEFLLPSVIPC